MNRCSTFSSRLPETLAVNRFGAALAARRAAGDALLDLTISNPTAAGLDYPAALLQPLGHAAGLSYNPLPAGLESAREAVAADYRRAGRRVAAADMLLTASTSEAYSLLFNLLADPGEAILVPRPSYPLFEHLARLDGLTVDYYDLEYHGRWSIDFGTLQAALTPDTRAILLVQPNNPTGSYITKAELEELAAIAAPRKIALISDEVFADYPLQPAAAAAAGDVLAATGMLTFLLGGCSKSIGLPQVKLGWIVAGGEPALRQAALQRLEYICDTYLSVSTPVQVAAAQLLEQGAAIRQQIRERIAVNHRAAAEITADYPWASLLTVEGGWSQPLRLPHLIDEEELVLQLLQQHDLVVHPGYFFDFTTRGIVVLSLLTPPADFAAGLERLLQHQQCLLP